MKASSLYPAIKFIVPVSELTRPAILLPETVKRITSPVTYLAGGAIDLTGSAILITVPVENMPEGVTGMTDPEDSFTGAERIFAVYVERTAGPDPLLTCSVNFLTGHAYKIAVFSRDKKWCKTAATACREVGDKIK